VGDPQGPYGIGIVLAEHSAAAGSIRERDRGIVSWRGFSTEISPMQSQISAAGRFEAPGAFNAGQL
jgi:hypothetical protein